MLCAYISWKSIQYGKIWLSDIFLTKKLQVIYSIVSTTFYIKDLLEPVLNNIISLNNILWGWVLSRTLFLIVINEVTTIIPKPLKMTMFTDDITLLLIGRSLRNFSIIDAESSW